jgi:hypothetical protein
VKNLTPAQIKAQAQKVVPITLAEAAAQWTGMRAAIGVRYLRSMGYYPCTLDGIKTYFELVKEAC